MHTPRHATDSLIKRQALKRRIIRAHQRDLLLPDPVQRVIASQQPDGFERRIPRDDLLLVGGQLVVCCDPAGAYD